MNERPTPETDRKAYDVGGHQHADGAIVTSDHARNLERQRDELLAALEESLALNINWADSTEPHNLEYFSEYRAVITQARAAIAAVKGGKL